MITIMDKRFITSKYIIIFLFFVHIPFFAEAKHNQQNSKPIQSVALPSGLFENSSSSPLLELLSKAQRNIDIEIYTMKNQKVRDHIRAAMEREVTIRIIEEPTPVGEACKLFTEADDKSATLAANSYCSDLKSLIQEVRNAGGIYIPFSKKMCANPDRCLEHGKMVIIDNRAAMLSTGNFDSTNLCDQDEGPTHCNRDYSYVTQDAELVSVLKTIFEKDLIGKPYDLDSILSKDTKGRLTVSPKSLSPLVNFIKSAKKELLIVNQYLKDPEMNQAIKNSAESGVDVQIMIASLCSFGKPSPSEIERYTKLFSDFENSGVTIRIFTKQIEVGGKSGYLHAKAIVEDESWAWVGSVNGSTAALTMNREFGIFFPNQNQVNWLKKSILKDIHDPGSETWQESLKCIKD